MATATATTVFVKDTRVEEWLRSRDIDFTGPRVIRMDQIDRRASFNNQARATAIVPEVAESYEEAIKNGQNLPAIVVYKVNQKYVIIDGNNRLEGAHKAHAEAVRAYIIDPNTPSEAIAMLTVTANTINGARVDKSWQLTNAVWLMETYGYTAKQVSAYMNVSVGAITAHEKERMSGRRAADLNVTGWDTMPVRVRQILGRIRLDRPFVIVAEACIASKFSNAQDLNALATKINGATTEEASIEIAAEWSRLTTAAARQAARQGVKHRTTNNPRLGLLTGLGKITAFNLGSFNAIFTTDEDREVVGERIEESIGVLSSMFKRLKGRDEAERVIMEIIDKLDEQE